MWRSAAAEWWVVGMVVLLQHRWMRKNGKEKDKGALDDQHLC
jgi:hypothetical protein